MILFTRALVENPRESLISSPTIHALRKEFGDGQIKGMLVAAVRDRERKTANDVATEHGSILGELPLLEINHDSP